MTKYVITPEVALRLAEEDSAVSSEHTLLAPTLLRSQFLSMLYRAVQLGEITRQDAERYLSYVRGLRMRLLGDRVLQSTAWKIAAQLESADTFDAEYIALTQLQADAFITLDGELGEAVRHLVEVAPFEVLFDPV